MHVCYSTHLTVISYSFHKILPIEKDGATYIYTNTHQLTHYQYPFGSRNYLERQRFMNMHKCKKTVFAIIDQVK